MIIGRGAGWWTGFGGCVIWALRVVWCGRSIVQGKKERGMNVRTIEVC